MKINARGQISIPSELRKKLGLKPGMEIEMEIVAQGLLIHKKNQQDQQDKVRSLIERMSGQGDIDLSTNQILQMTRGED